MKNRKIRTRYFLDVTAFRPHRWDSRGFLLLVSSPISATFQEIHENEAGRIASEKMTGNNVTALRGQKFQRPKKHSETTESAELQKQKSNTKSWRYQ